MQTRKVQEGQPFERQNNWELQVIEEERNTINNDKLNNQKGQSSSVRDSEDIPDREKGFDSPYFLSNGERVMSGSTNQRYVKQSGPPRKISLEEKPRIHVHQFDEKELGNLAGKYNPINLEDDRRNSISRTPLHISVNGRQSLGDTRAKSFDEQGKVERSQSKQIAVPLSSGIVEAKTKEPPRNPGERSPISANKKNEDPSLKSPLKKSAFGGSNQYPPFEGVMRTIRKFSSNLDSPELLKSKSRHDQGQASEKEDVTPRRLHAQTISMLPSTHEIQREMVHKRLKGQNYSGDLEAFRSRGESLGTKEPRRRRKTVGESSPARNLLSRALRENMKTRLTDCNNTRGSKKKFSIARVSKGEICMEKCRPMEPVIPQLKNDDNSSSSVQSDSLERPHTVTKALEHPQSLVGIHREVPAAQGQ
jgi:hypothetical protein